MCHQSKSFPLATSRSYKTRESNKKQHLTIYNVCNKWCQSHQMHKATNPCLTMFTNNNNYSPYAVKSWVLSWLCMQNFWFSNVTVCSNNWAQYILRNPLKSKQHLFTYVLFLRVLSKPNSSDSLLQKKQNSQLYS